MPLSLYFKGWAWFQIHFCFVFCTQIVIVAVKKCTIKEINVSFSSFLHTIMFFTLSWLSSFSFLLLNFCLSQQPKQLRSSSSSWLYTWGCILLHTHIMASFGIACRALFIVRKGIRLYPLDCEGWIALDEFLTQCALTSHIRHHIAKLYLPQFKIIYCCAFFLTPRHKVALFKLKIFAIGKKLICPTVLSETFKFLDSNSVNCLL